MQLGDYLTQTNKFQPKICLGRMLTVALSVAADTREDTQRAANNFCSIKRYLHSFVLLYGMVVVVVPRYLYSREERCGNTVTCHAQTSRCIIFFHKAALC
jgi:hypothetical protein